MREVPMAKKGKLSLDQMIAEARASLDLVIAEMHDDCEVATEAGDIGTADLYTRLAQVHQKSRWFLNEILQKRDGLTSCGDVDVRGDGGVSPIDSVHRRRPARVLAPDARATRREPPDAGARGAHAPVPRPDGDES